MQKIPFIMYGGDYNPNQWSEDIRKEDMNLFKKAHINTLTINVFSWARLQPDEETYDWSELDRIVDMLSRKNFSIIMATSTAAMPAWLSKKYLSVNRVDYNGVRKRFGIRHNFCPNSPEYRRLSVALAGKLAARYKDNPNIVLWHVSNEYGGRCFCENCENAFRQWLKARYGDIETLNRAWNTEFWGHTYYNWDEIVVPNNLSDGEGGVAYFGGLTLDYNRFNSESLLNCFKAERDAIREHIPNAYITTNLMGAYKTLDYFMWAKEMDVVSWDCYPSYDTPWSKVAFLHDLMYGLKQKPFLLMEQTPNQQNWQAYNSLKKPGQMRAQSYQSIAHGSDSVLFFQMRQSRGGCEKFHGAVISHAGTSDTRIFKEVSQLGHELEKIGDRILDYKSCATVALIFDWDNFWALEDSIGPTKDLQYVELLHNYYQYFYKKNIGIDIVSCKADFSKYKLVLAPVLYMVKSDVAERLERYVSGGGTLVTGVMSGIVDENDNVHLGGYPGLLRKLCGVWSEEVDALAPEQSNTLRFSDGVQASCGFLCDILHTEGADTVAVYGQDFYASTPAITVNCYDNGHVWYIGTAPDEIAAEKLFGRIVSESGVLPYISEKTELEISCRALNGKKYWFIINFTDDDLPVPEVFLNRYDILSEENIKPSKKLAKYDVIIVE